MIIKNKKLKLLLSLSLFGVLLIPISSTIMILNHKIVNSKDNNLSILDNLLNFEDIPLTPKYRKSWENLEQTSYTYSAAYDWKYKVTLENYMKEIIDGNKESISVNFNQKKPITTKSKLTDDIYLGLQVMGYNSPVVSQLNETARYEISNFSALEDEGYSLYITKTDANNLLEIINQDSEDSYEYENETYFKLINLNKTDNIFFRTSEQVNSQTISKWNGQSIPIKLLAKKENTSENILKIYDPYYHRNSLNVSILNSNSNEFIQYKLWDWNQYNSNNENLQAYIANNLIKIYIEIALSYIDYIDPSSDMHNVKALPLEGIDDVFSHKEGGGGGATPGSLLYYAYKYNSFMI